MKIVFGAGIILFRNSSNSKQYLLILKTRKKKWEAPKGRREKDETDFDTAIRETFEETGLVETKDFDILDRDFTLEYFYKNEKREKKVTYWMANYKGDAENILLSESHTDFKWVGLNDALNLIEDENLRNVIIQADGFISSRNF